MVNRQVITLWQGASNVDAVVSYNNISSCISDRV